MDNMKKTKAENKGDSSPPENKTNDFPPKGTSIREQVSLLFLSDDSSRQIALGAAIGVFLAFSPFLGLHTIAAIALALFFRASRLAAVLGTLINNPVTMTFFYFFEIKLGSSILGLTLEIPHNLWKNISELFALGGKAFASIMTGFVIIGAVCAVLAYFITLGVANAIRSRRTDTTAV
jgi:uncharacterized protein